MKQQLVVRQFFTLAVLLLSHLCHSFGIIPTRRNPRALNAWRISTNMAPTASTRSNRRHNSPLIKLCHHGCSDHIDQDLEAHQKSRRLIGLLRYLWKRLDIIELAGYAKDDTVLVSGLFGKVKQLHNPITYFVLGILGGFRWDWCFKSPLYWFAIGFTIKWYRAKYVFKIPVWDRQPNWNNIITSKEQEKDLKAFTCKICGSTIFIAKTREFFFEGSTGIGGLGCFSCGAKGAENFVMDRDRILEDVADVDDYFEYERPLDFVSRAERRKLLKEAEGDEDRANLILLERTTGMSSAPSSATAPIDTAATDVKSLAMTEEDDLPSVEAGEPTTESQETQPTAVVPNHSVSDEKTARTPKLDMVSSPLESIATAPKATKLSTDPAPGPSSPPKSTSSRTEKSSVDLEGLDELDMDAW